jgi:hypothetical protein
MVTHQLTQYPAGRKLPVKLECLDQPVSGKLVAKCTKGVGKRWRCLDALTADPVDRRTQRKTALLTVCAGPGKVSVARIADTDRPTGQSTQQATWG